MSLNQKPHNFRKLSMTMLAIHLSTLTPAASFGEEGQVRQIGRMNFWFHSGDAAERILTETHEGISSITYAGRQGKELNAKINAAGMAHVAGVGGIIRTQGHTVADGVKTLKKVVDQIVDEGADAIYIDEPVGPALAMECGADCYDAKAINATPKGVRFIVDAFNEVSDHFHSRRPGGQFGICVGDGGGLAFHMAALKAGLREDFACLEQYGSAHRRPFDDFKKQFPNVKTMLLVYNTRALCSDNDASAFDTWGFWNLDNHMDWIPGPIGDADWLANAALFAKGDKSFCNRPISQITVPLTWESQSANFNLTAKDSSLVKPAPFALGACEYKVVSNGAETRPWTARDCNKPFRVTVGPGKECRDNGQSACLVHVRAHTANDEVGNAQFTRFNIGF